MNFRAILILIVFFIVTGCEPVDFFEYQQEEIETEEEQKTGGGSTIKDWEYDYDTTVYDLKPSSKVYIIRNI